jgi:hypothetical protein
MSEFNPTERHLLEEAKRLDPRSRDRSRTVGLVLLLVGALCIAAAAVVELIRTGTWTIQAAKDLGSAGMTVGFGLILFGHARFRRNALLLIRRLLDGPARGGPS